MLKYQCVRCVEQDADDGNHCPLLEGCKATSFASLSIKVTAVEDDSGTLLVTRHFKPLQRLELLTLFKPAT